MRTFVSLLCMVLLLTACGKKGALIYPEMLVPAAPSAVTARQSGTAIKLSFILPQRDRAGRNLKDLAGIKVLRREAATGQEESCNACTADFSLFRKIYLDLPEESVQRYGSLLLLLDTDVRSGSDYSYILVPFNKNALDGESTLTVTAGMVPPPLPPTLSVTPAPTEIQLRFASSRKEQGTLLGFNLYRVIKGEPMSYLPHNKELLPTDSYVDTGLERRVTYTYVARSVLRMSSGKLVESEASNAVSAQLLDE